MRPAIRPVIKSLSTEERQARESALMQAFPIAVAPPDDGRSQIDGSDLVGWPPEL